MHHVGVSRNRRNKESLLAYDLNTQSRKSLPRPKFCCVNGLAYPTSHRRRAELQHVREQDVADNLSSGLTSAIVEQTPSLSGTRSSGSGETLTTGSGTRGMGGASPVAAVLSFTSPKSSPRINLHRSP